MKYVPVILGLDDEYHLVLADKKTRDNLDRLYDYQWLAYKKNQEELKKLIENSAKKLGGDARAVCIAQSFYDLLCASKLEFACSLADCLTKRPFDPANHENLFAAIYKCLASDEAHRKNLLDWYGDLLDKSFIQKLISRRSIQEFEKDYSQLPGSAIQNRVPVERGQSGYIQKELIGERQGGKEEPENGTAHLQGEGQGQATDGQAVENKPHPATQVIQGTFGEPERTTEAKPLRTTMIRVATLRAGPSSILAHGAPLSTCDHDVQTVAWDPKPLAVLATGTGITSPTSITYSLIADTDVKRTAALLRFKLLGEVVAIKQELIELLRAYYSESDSRKNSPLKCAEELHPHLGKFGQRLIGAGYWLDNMLAKLLAMHIIKTWSWLAGLMLIAVALLASASWLLPVYWLTWWFPLSPATVTAGSALLLGLGIFTAGFNFQTLKERLAAHRHEELEENLRGALARLAQFNVSVQVGNVQSDSNSMAVVPEGFIREVDKLLQTHEAVHSLESTIKSRLATVGETLRELRAKQRKSRRMVLAAGGAIFTGFFAHEVGMSVLEFQHLREKIDSHHFLVWLGSDEAHKVSSSVTAAPQSQVSHPPYDTLAAKYQETFGEHALHGMGVVLFITLVFTVCVAVLAMRKSDDDDAHHGGHGGHH